MLNSEQRQFNDILINFAEELDIPPSKYKQAVERYSAVGNWLEAGEYENACGRPDIYPQGSFRLGTVIRPIRDGKEVDYDIDLVCQLPQDKSSTTAKALKQVIGGRLKANASYKRMLDEEGRRCWTLEYAEEDGIGFHMDVLPSIPTDSNGLLGLRESGVHDRYNQHAIDITDKDKDTYVYEWKPSGSNPRGYAIWFEDINKAAHDRVELNQKRAIVQNFSTIYESVETVPDALIRTPLQRAIQILKRHRDLCFRDNPEIKPISMIITTLAAQAYDGETELYTALVNIVDKITNHETSKLIKHVEGEWRIPNPVNPKENFADRWNDGEESPEKVRAFFDWLKKVRQEFDSYVGTKGLHVISEGLRESFGERVATAALKKYGNTLKKTREGGNLKYAFGTGMLGSHGDATVKEHIFYGC